MMRVGVVVLHFRFWPDVRVAVDTLLAQVPPPDQVVIVDNDSGAEQVAAMRAAWPAITVIEAGANLGYAGGMNLGIRHLAPDVDAVLLLTHETVLAEGALAALASHLGDHPRVAAAGPVLATHSQPDTVFSAGGWIQDGTWDTRHHREPTELAAWSGQPPRTVDWLDGCCWLVRTAALDAVGLLDEDFFLYFEEFDMHRRLVAAGWELACVPAAVAWQESGGKPDYLWARNRLRVLARHAPRRALLRDLARIAVRALRAVIGRVRRDDIDVPARAQVAAVRDFLLGRYGPPPDRYHPGRQKT